MKCEGLPTLAGGYRPQAPLGTEKGARRSLELFGALFQSGYFTLVKNHVLNKIACLFGKRINFGIDVIFEETG